MNMTPHLRNAIAATILLLSSFSLANADTIKPLDAKILLLDADIKAQVSHYEAVSTALLNATSEARSPVARDKAVLEEISDKISHLIGEKKDSEAAIKEKVAKYNALVSSD